MDYKALAEAALEARARLVNEARSINDDANLSDAEKRERIERVNADIEARTVEARVAVERGEREAEVRSLAQRAGSLFAPAGDEQGPEAREALDLDAQFRAVALGESRGFNMQTTGNPNVAFRAAAGANTATTGTSAWAGTTIPNKFVAEVLEKLWEFSPILQAGARIVNTSSGEKMEWPFKNGRLAAARVAEGATYPRSTASFQRVGVDAYKYGVIAEATTEMLNDSAIPLASIIAEDLGEALAVATALDFLKGDGTSGPQGLLTATVLGDTIADQTALTADSLVQFQHTLTPRYRANAKWYVSDDFVLHARLLKDGMNRYIWQDSLTAGAPDLLLGKPVMIDVNMDNVSGGSKKPALFADFSKFLVRNVGAVNISRSDEYGWDSDVVAWKGNFRCDSVLTDAAASSALTVTA